MISTPPLGEALSTLPFGCSIRLGGRLSAGKGTSGPGQDGNAHQLFPLRESKRTDERKKPTPYLVAIPLIPTEVREKKGPKKRAPRIGKEPSILFFLSGWGFYTPFFY